MNASKFVYKGISLDLNVNEIAVDARAQAAMDTFVAKVGEFAKEENPVPFSATVYVQLLHDTVNAIFDRDNAADLLFEGEKTLSGYAEAFTKIAGIIGTMRGIALKNAANVTSVVVANATKKT